MKTDVMDPFALATHLMDDHGADWADDLDADAANRLHHHVHRTPNPNLLPIDHDHVWDDQVADPQGPLRRKPADGDDEAR